MGRKQIRKKQKAKERNSHFKEHEAFIQAGDNGSVRVIELKKSDIVYVEDGKSFRIKRKYGKFKREIRTVI